MAPNLLYEFASVRAIQFSGKKLVHLLRDVADGPDEIVHLAVGFRPVLVHNPPAAVAGEFRISR